MRDKRLIAVEYRRVKKIRDREIIGKKIELELHTECHSRFNSLHKTESYWKLYFYNPRTKNNLPGIIFAKQEWRTEIRKSLRIKLGNEKELKGEDQTLEVIREQRLFLDTRLSGKQKRIFKRQLI